MFLLLPLDKQILDFLAKSLYTFRLMFPFHTPLGFLMFLDILERSTDMKWLKVRCFFFVNKQCDLRSTSNIFTWLLKNKLRVIFFFTKKRRKKKERKKKKKNWFDTKNHLFNLTLFDFQRNENYTTMQYVSNLAPVLLDTNGQ